MRHSPDHWEIGAMDIEARIQQYVAQNLLFSDDGLQYSNDASFLLEGIIDSLGVIELVTFVQRTFELVVTSDEITPDNFDSVNRLAHYIRHKIGCNAMSNV